MGDLRNISYGPKDSIQTVIVRMTAHDPRQSGVVSGVALIVDGHKKLLGIATDGDIRKGIAAGVSLDRPIAAVMNKRPFVLQEGGSREEMLGKLGKALKERNWHKSYIEKVIVVDKKNVPVDIISTFDLWRSSDVRFKRIGVVGLGYVGLTLALSLADLGFDVLGYDTNPKTIRDIKKGKPHFFEKGLHELLKDHLNKNFIPVSRITPETRCDVYLIAVGTPLDEKNIPNLSHIENAARCVGRHLEPGNLVILRSTVPIGTTRSVVTPILAKESGLVAGTEFHVAFAPERTIEGKAIEELRQLPQVIGGYNHAAAELASNVFGFLTKSIVMVDSLEEAEMVKLINNTYRDVTFAYANEMSLVARRWGLDTKRVIEAANFGYTRSNVPMPSPGVGGYCLEKDPFILMESAKRKGYEPMLLRHARHTSSIILDSVADDVMAYLGKIKKTPAKAKIFIIGFAFKGRPATSDVRGSTTYGLISRLKALGIKNIHGYDPYVSKADIVKAGVAYVLKPDHGMKESDVVVVMNNNADFEKMDIRAHLETVKNPVLLLDTWSLYPKDEIAKLKHVTHYRL